MREIFSSLILLEWHPRYQIKGTFKYKIKNHTYLIRSKIK